jgi:ribonuclease P protein component
VKLISLKRKLEFKLLFAKGRRIYKDHINVVYLLQNRDEEDLGSLKLAYVVSKKISPKAVIRNKIKRRMRVSVRQTLKDNQEKFDGLKANGLIAIRASSNKIIDASFQILNFEIKKSLEQIIS